MSAFTPKMNEDEMQCDGCGRVVGKRDNDYCTTCQPPEVIDATARADMASHKDALAMLTGRTASLERFRDEVTGSMSADLGRALGMCEALAMRVEALEAIRRPPLEALDAEARMGLRAARDRIEALEATGILIGSHEPIGPSGLTKLEEKLSAARDEWEGRCSAAVKAQCVIAADRDEWRRQHENLLEVRRVDLEALQEQRLAAEADRGAWKARAEKAEAALATEGSPDAVRLGARAWDLGVRAEKAEALAGKLGAELEDFKLGRQYCGVSEEDFRAKGSFSVREHWDALKAERDAMRDALMTVAAEELKAGKWAMGCTCGDRLPYIYSVVRKALSASVTR